jgi:CRP/FNR family transcriptional regulator, dissimilatory nitrate respiration regulator
LAKAAKGKEALLVDSADRRIALQALLLRNLPEDLALALIESAAVKDYARGEAIFLQGDPADFIGVVLDGWVKLFRVKPNGAEAVIGVFTRGNSFGEAPAVMETVFPVSATAVTDCRLLQIRAAPLIDLMARNPAVTRAILAATLTHLHGLVHQIEQLKGQSGAQRLAEFLVSLTPVEAGPCTLTLPYDKSLVAARLGMKPESLSRALARLRDLGVNVPQNQVVIADVAALRAFSEEDRVASWRRAE